MIGITISTLISMPFNLRPCKDSLRVIFCPGKQETTVLRYFFIMVLYVALVSVTFYCVVKGYNLEDVLTVISTFCSPLVSHKKRISILSANCSIFCLLRLNLLLLDLLDSPILVLCQGHDFEREEEVLLHLLLLLVPDRTIFHFLALVSFGHNLPDVRSSKPLERKQGC